MFRYINDVPSLNKSEFGDFVDHIDPNELEIKHTTNRSVYTLTYNSKFTVRGR